jgi:acetyl esterase/lipase
MLSRDRRIMIAILASTSLLICSQAMAQMPPDIAEKVAVIGRVSDPVKTSPLYAPLHQKEPYAGVKVTRDVKYGPHERNTLDLFVPETAGTGRAVFLYVHGGGFIRGSKREAGSPFYDNIMLWAVHNGMIGINVEYRLAPQFAWPSVGEDLGAAVRWAGENAGTYGGDPNRVYLMGHSSGATHVAIYVSHPEFHGPKGSGLAGAMFSSGTYDLSKLEPAEGRGQYFGMDKALYRERSALPGLLKTSIPFMANAAELDPPWMVEQIEELKAAMCESPRGCIRSLIQPKHNHMSQPYAIGTADTMLTGQLLEFIKTGK